MFILLEFMFGKSRNGKKKKNFSMRSKVVNISCSIKCETSLRSLHWRGVREWLLSDSYPEEKCRLQQFPLRIILRLPLNVLLVVIFQIL